MKHLKDKGLPEHNQFLHWIRLGARVIQPNEADKVIKEPLKMESVLVVLTRTVKEGSEAGVRDETIYLESHDDLITINGAEHEGPKVWLAMETAKAKSYIVEPAQ